jgi:hypothetical protein
MSEKAITLVSAAAAVLAALVAWLAYCETKQANLSADLNRSMSAYLAGYLDANSLLSAGDPLRFAAAYQALPVGDRRRVEILNGLLVSVVDAMYASGDCRASVWASFLQNSKGPSQSGALIEGFAKQPETRSAIAASRTSIFVTEESIKDDLKRKCKS